MQTVEIQTLDSEPSPRSTVIATSGHMTSNVHSMNESNMASDVADSELKKMASSAKDVPKDSTSNNTPNPASPSLDGKESRTSSTKDGIKNNKERVVEDAPPTPNAYEYPMAHVHGYPPTLTPQGASAGYHYLTYNPQHMTPEPPSPAGPHAVSADMYSAASFFHQPGAFGTALPHHNSFGMPGLPMPNSNNSNANPTLSPNRGAMPTVPVSMGNIPPSPLFPRSTSLGTAGTLDGNQRGANVAPPSPNIPYIMSPQHLGGSSANMYQTYQVVGVGSHSSDDGANWTGNRTGDRTQNQVTYPSPQMNPNGIPVYAVMPVNRAGAGGRAYSFDETMLPPSALDQDQGNPAYSPYPSSQTSPGASHYTHASWGYGTHPDVYTTPGSPLPPRAQAQMPIYPPMGPGNMRAMGPYGQYYPASSPGPPIQTTASNKGPDGANLFIFHIPNHFTNLDMYQLFSPYGNLLSVRIMVEKDTGRSRGFGFVSYDSPESAATAIKELNGFAVGNKRLKVQHKQIRPRDLQDRDSPQDSFGMGPNNDGDFQRSPFPSSLPPSGALANNNMWPDSSRHTEEGTEEDTDESGKQQQQQHEEGKEFANSSAGAEAPIHMNEQQSPLASLGQMQNALPDISGNGSSE
jgi:hypothetical protein